MLVMAHREEASWVRSTWAFHEAPARPGSLGFFLADEAPRRWAQGVDLLDRLEQVRSTGAAGAARGRQSHLKKKSLAAAVRWWVWHGRQWLQRLVGSGLGV